MRRLRSCVLPAMLAVATLGLPGCFVLEEIDSGMELMDKHSSADKKKKKAEEEKAAAAEGERPPTYQEAQESWWKDAKSLSLSPDEAGASDDPTVACKHAGKTLFTKRSDCIARGGQPG